MPSLVKSLLLALAILATSATSKSLNSTTPLAFGSNHLIVGSRQPGDLLVLEKEVSVSASWIGLIVEHEETYQAPKDYVITQVTALDHATDGTGATAALTSGGPGYVNATLEFESQRFHGIYFTVQLYARTR